jgi:predicted DNA-binding transcriptional regulator
MMAAAIVIILVYVWALFFAGPLGWQIAISALALVAVGAVCGIIIWIGYTLATTPPPKPIEEIEKEIASEMSEIKE